MTTTKNVTTIHHRQLDPSHSRAVFCHSVRKTFIYTFLTKSLEMEMEMGAIDLAAVHRQQSVIAIDACHWCEIRKTTHYNLKDC